MRKSITRKPQNVPQTLPPTGLAEDVLGTPVTPTNGAQAFDTIYAFADSLARSESKDAKQIEQRLETWVTFGLAGESFGLPVTHVQEILRVTQITRVPHTPAAVRGVTNMRGRVLPVVDLRVRLGIEAGTIDPHSRVLVVTSRGRLLGLLVDAVQQVLRLDRDQVEPPPPDVMTTQSDYILGVYHQGDGLAILLDVDKVLVVGN